MIKKQKAKPDNMALWNKVSKTDPKTTKVFKGKGGFNGTAICAQAQRRKATEVFGPFGVGWNVGEETFEKFDLSEDPHESQLVYRATMHFVYEDKEYSFGLTSEIQMFSYVKSYSTWIITNDMRKKVRTDAITKGLSELGFNSDVFEGKFDDNKYVQAMREDFAEPPPATKSNRKPASKPSAKLPDWAVDCSAETQRQIKQILKWKGSQCQELWDGIADQPDVTKAEQFAFGINEYVIEKSERDS